MLLGRLPNSLTIDQKGRLVIPSRIRDSVFRESQEDSIDFHIGCLLDKCLYLHTEEQHAAFLEAFDRAVDNTEANRRLKTLVNSSFVPVTTDKAGRISIPAFLLAKAGIKKEVVVVGMVERVELWGAELHQDLEAEHQVEFRASLEDALAKAGSFRRPQDADREGNE